jgi:methionyl-tRNA formyltransferase
MKNNLKIDTLVVIGGNIYDQEFPIQNILDTIKKYQINIFIITDKSRLTYPNKRYKNFETFLKKKKLSYKIFKKYNSMSLFLNKKFDKKKTLILSVNCKWRIKNDIIDKFINLFNYHNAELPTQRGAACHSWGLMMNKKFSSLNIHKVKEDFDVGNIVLSKKYSFKKPVSNLNSVYKKIEQVEKIFFKTFFKKFFYGKLENKKQKNVNSFYWPKLKQSRDAFVQWKWTSNQIKLFCDAFDLPFKGVIAKYNRSKILLKDAMVSDSNLIFHPFQYGMIYRKFKNRIYVATCTGGISFKLSINNFKNIKLGYKFYN